jgi:hypothetical protein
MTRYTIPFGGFQETPLTKKVLYGKKIDLAIKMGKAAPVPNSASTICKKPVPLTEGPPPSSELIASVLLPAYFSMAVHKVF